jgi:O-antigen/teichoic acid export membrane protein
MVGGQVAVALVGLIGVRLLTELAPREIFGEASLLLGIQALCKNIFTTPLSNGQTRFHSGYLQRGHAHWFTRQLARYTWIGSGIGILFYIPGFIIWRTLRGGEIRLVLLFALVLMSLIDVPKTLRLVRLGADRLWRQFAVWSASEALLGVAFSAAALCLYRSAASLIIGQVAAATATLLLFGFALFPTLPEDRAEVPPESERELRRKLLRYGAAFVPIAVFGWILNVGDRYALEGFLGPKEVGLYVAAYSIASRPFIMVSGVIAAVARPIMFEAANAEQDEKARKVFRLWLVLLAVIVVAGLGAMLLLGNVMADVFLAADYRPKAANIFIWVGLGYALYSMEQVVENRILTFGASGRLLWPTALGATANVLLNILLIPRYGVLGAAYATAATFGLQLLISAVVLLAIGNARVASE